MENSETRKSNRFDTTSLHYKGVYYFTKDIMKSKRNPPLKDRPFQIQGIFSNGKLYQDTFYITEKFKNFLLSNE